MEVPRFSSNQITLSVHTFRFHLENDVPVCKLNLCWSYSSIVAPVTSRSVPPIFVSSPDRYWRRDLSRSVPSEQALTLRVQTTIIFRVRDRTFKFLALGRVQYRCSRLHTATINYTLSLGNGSRQVTPSLSVRRRHKNKGGADLDVTPPPRIYTRGRRVIWCCLIIVFAISGILSPRTVKQRQTTRRVQSTCLMINMPCREHLLYVRLSLLHVCAQYIASKILVSPLWPLAGFGILCSKTRTITPQHR